MPIDVTNVRPELTTLLPTYTLIRDCIEGEPAIKGYAKRNAQLPQNALHTATQGGVWAIQDALYSRTYLPMPNAQDRSEQNLMRYQAYVQRAIFYNITARTRDGMVGQIYLREPIVKTPALLQAVIKDADGSGLSLTQLSKRAVQYTLSFGRCGIYVDYPNVTTPATLAELQQGDIRPTMTVYAPEDVINWRTIRRGAKTILSLVVLHEQVLKNDVTNVFDVCFVEQYRVLRLVNNEYRVEVWQQLDTKDWQIIEAYQPLDGNGQPWNEIPFTFIGSENNDSFPDKPPLYDLAILNIGHYRNSADYEESAFITGQPTLAVTGLTEDWYNQTLNGTITLGSRAAVPLPVGGDMKLIQAAPNSLPFEAMKQKEEQMIALGAKLVQQVTARRTATEVYVDTATESSVLANIANNVSSAFTFALEWCAVFTNLSEKGIEFKLNNEFDLSVMSFQDRQELIAEWQKGAIAWPEMRDGLRKAGVVTLDDTEAKALIDAELEQMPLLQDNQDPTLKPDVSAAA